jgi:predicted TIM-barrel fold metal-dependent hydrolase
MEKNLFGELRQELERIPLVDTHEHFILEDERLGLALDMFYLFPHYASSDLISSGMPHSVLEEIRCSELPLETKWKKFWPYWLRIKNTAYCKVLKIIAQDIFGVEDINEKTYRVLSERIASSNKKGWYSQILQDKANMKCCIVNFLGRGKVYAPPSRIEDSLDSMDQKRDMKIPPLGLDILKPVGTFDGLVSIWNLKQIRRLERDYDTNIHTLDDLLKVLDLSFEARVKEGIVGVKTVLAYNRIIRYEKTTRYQAEERFNRIFDHLGEGISWREARPLQDFLMHQVIRRAIEARLPIQIHTGFQEGSGNIITNANPTHLANLFIQYPQATFDIFHASYPYMGEFTILAKNFPNVYADLCWTHIISPYAARRVLSELIETLPSNKIFGFGGDYLIVEGAYAHAKIARDNIAKVLAEKVEENYFSLSEAIEFARKILCDNPLEVFNVGSV